MRELWKSAKPWERIAGALLLAAVVFGAVSCTPTQPTPGSIVITNTNTNTTNTGGGGASPSPDAGGTVARVGIGKVAGAETCPVGTQPSGRGDAVRIGCTAFLTCSPYDATNRELFDPASIGTAPESFGLVSGDAVTVAPHGTNGFNLDATGAKAGSATFGCKVKGVQSPPFVLQVVQ